MFKVGDKVYDVRLGWGVVVRIIEGIYKIEVSFKEHKALYTDDGFIDHKDTNRSLFFKEIAIPKDALVRPRFRAEEGVQYVVVTCTGTLNYCTERLSWTDEEYYSCGNYFETEEEAKESDLYKVYNR
ncbi:MAG: hypothetical protein ACRC6A_09255 [Fusobacteriaceae bacterium]